MAIPGGMDERRVIPLWLDPKAAATTGERDSVTPPRRLTAREEHWLRRLSTNLADQESEAAALELATSASILGTPEAAGPAARQLRPFTRLTAQLHSKGKPELISSTSREIACREVKRLRKKLSNPHQPLAWSELSRNYLLLGRKEKARRAMEAAIAVATPSRYILRSATRLFVHLDEADRALHYLQRHPGLRDDPWLLAAEISTNSVLDQESRLLVHSTRKSNANDVPPAHLAELRAALATVEYEQGQRRRSKEMLSKSSVGANSNVLAQIEWIGSIDPSFAISERLDRAALTGEAEAWRARSDKDWRQVLLGCDRWLAIEPYSSRPAMLASYTAHTVLRDYKSSIKYCSEGLAWDAEHFTLLNNRACAYARLGDIDAAVADAQKAASFSVGDEVPVIIATLGLISFRSGNPAAGNRLYEESIDEFLSEGKRPHAVMALVHMAEELMRYSLSEARSTLEYAKKARRFLSGPTDLEMDVYIDALSKDFNEARTDAPHTLNPAWEVLHERIAGIHARLREKHPPSNATEYKWPDLLKNLISRSTSMKST